MKASGVDKYGPIENFCEKELPKPSDLSPRDLLDQGFSVNPVDTKVRNGTYDDYPAYEALVERLEITRGEKAALLIINGAGGVGAVASQIARTVLDLPYVITTASRPETTEFTKQMGATHVVNHRDDIPAQIAKLDLDVPLKYIFITSSTDQYMSTCGKLCAPFGKLGSIVQGQANMYGTDFMFKSMSFI
ncbi:hypothetical protein SI65_01954 [Aspergillus cristatus]|uniref:Alcohol dehydrogenase-like C-terminal domain-containing protein n=1 Tax=Aspergillus cristatus TaxID=573508 RepID=A0A1E3BTR1_ASPCR|nr:hypothetical protein SI65_01954 [Aspergillus cristatus]